MHFRSALQNTHANKQGALQAHLKVKGLVEPSGGVNMVVYFESVSVAVASFPVCVQPGPLPNRARIECCSCSGRCAIDEADTNILQIVSQTIYII